MSKKHSVKIKNLSGIRLNLTLQTLIRYKAMEKKISMFISGLFILFNLQSQELIEFSRENSSIYNGMFDTIDGRPAFAGTAILKDIEFRNGTLEWDMWTTGGRSYAGVTFRYQNNRDSEEFYVRPHKGNGLFPDAFQYTPIYHGVSCWQLSHGSGGTKAAKIPAREWIHFKLVVKDNRALLTMYTQEPVSMNIDRLWHGDISGSVGVKGPVNGSSWFANFTWTDKIDIDMPDKALKYNAEPGIIRRWEISRVLSYNETDPYMYYEDQNDLDWKNAETDDDGLINLTKQAVRNPQLPGWIYARSVLNSEKDKIARFQLAYSDYITVFVNGLPIMSSTNAYTSRDPAFAGLIGYFDEVFLPLKKGPNEICLLIGEQFGGWGFKMRDAEAIGLAEGISKNWELHHKLGYPESVVYDQDENILYFSNNITGSGGGISKLSTDGKNLDYEWVKGLNSPTGITLYGNEIYVVERSSVAVIDKYSGIITERIKLEEAVFPNDITVDDKGVIYISDSGGSKIYRIRDKVSEIWLERGDILNPNGIDYHDGLLYVGCSGDASVKKIDIKTFCTSTIATLPDGSVMDGLQVSNKGEVFFSDFNGHLFRIDPSGELVEIINTVSRQLNIADFELVDSKNQLIIPGLYSNVISAYSFLKVNN